MSASETQMQLSLGGLPVEDWRARFDDGSYPERFWSWLSNNVHVLDAFVKLALRTQAAGAEHYSADGLCHVLRWRSSLTDGLREPKRNPYKINNSYVAGLARLAMELHPRLQGFFETRSPPRREEAA